jgi:hypothetical protein
VIAWATADVKLCAVDISQSADAVLAATRG